MFYLRIKKCILELFENVFYLVKANVMRMNKIYCFRLTRSRNWSVVIQLAERNKNIKTILRFPKKQKYSWYLNLYSVVYSLHQHFKLVYVFFVHKMFAKQFSTRRKQWLITKFACTKNILCKLTGMRVKVCNRRRVCVITRTYRIL